ncbi:MAG: domain S-box protein, partial [Bacillota bacterium]|nr:domain S-box protein [Bacillota bacterium]
DSISSAYQKTRLLERLVSDLFELAQFESSQFTFNFSLLSFNESFLPIFQKFAHDAEQAGYSFILNLSEELKKENPEFILDLERIDQVMYNLVNNAMKNTKKGGTITVDCGMLGSGSISIRIQDSGHGISEQDLPYIFDMFYTSQSTGGSRGTGLGLATISHRIG